MWNTATFQLSVTLLATASSFCNKCKWAAVVKLGSFLESVLSELVYYDNYETWHYSRLNEAELKKRDRRYSSGIAMHAMSSQML